MKGTRQGDFTRLRQPGDNTSSVRMQQGRVQLDADWNEGLDLLASRLRQGTLDLVGESGAPAADPGFEVTAGELGLELGAGGHFLLVGGAEGFRLPERENGGDRGLRVEARLVAHGEGRLLSLWERPPERRKFRVVWGLVLEGRRLVLRRAGGEEVVGAEVSGLVGGLHRFAVDSGPEGAVVLVDGAVVGSGPGVDVPGGPLSVMVGTHGEPVFRGLAQGLRMGWLAGDGAGSGAKMAEELGRWKFSRQGGGERRGEVIAAAGGGGGGRGYPDPSATNATGSGHPRPATGGGAADSAAQREDRQGGESQREEIGADGFGRSGPLEGQEGSEPERRPGGARVGLEGRPAGEGERRGRDSRRFEDLGGLGVAAEVRGGEGGPRWLPVDLGLGAGRFYAGGVLCRRGEEGTFRGQGDLPGAALPSPGGLEPEHHVVYLDLWERTVGPVEDPALLEPALGGADTVTHGRLVAQVRTAPWRGGEGEEGEGEADGGMPTFAGVHAAWTSPVPLLPERGRLAARRRKPAAVELDNSLYRVEVHRGEEGPGPVTFKWSRHNASVVYPVASLAAEGVVRVGPSGRDLDGLVVGAVVELVEHDSAVLVRPASLHRVAGIDPSRQQVTLTPAPPLPSSPSEDGTSRGAVALRLWDQASTSAGTGYAVAARPGQWQDLEHGIQVRFEGSAPYRAGDYWWLPARTVTGDVDWPTDDHGEALSLPPAGIEHVTAPLALLSYTRDGFRLTDLRKTFHPHAIDAVRKAGDWMDGPLDLRADLRVGGDVEVAGRLRADSLYGRVVSPGAVGPRQLALGAVTVRSLAPDVGVVPEGASILLPGRESPPGFADTGWVVSAERDEPGWVDRAALPNPQPGPLVSVAIEGQGAEGRVYSLFESGEVWGYDPIEDTWQGGLGLPEPLHAYAACAHDGGIYVAGGIAPEGQPSERLLRYDPRRGDWVELAPLPTPRSHLALVACGGRLHALGGWEAAWLGPRASRRHEIYEPGIDTWTSARRLRLARPVVAASAAAIGDRIHLAGGEGRWLFGRWGSYLSDDHRLYREGTGAWAAVAALPSPRRRVGLAVVDSHLAAVGGEGPQGWTADVDLYDPASNTWRGLPPLHRVIEAPGVTAQAGTLHVTGAPAADGTGVLMETCPVRARFHVHRRDAEGQP